jgi:hypothetical protein
METAVENYLNDLVADSSRWQRLGQYGSAIFVDGLLSGLSGVGVISTDEVSSWKAVLLAPFGSLSAQFHSAQDRLFHRSSVSRINGALFQPV